jgi:AAA+ ATPase superfamily predicted ATPase
METPFVFGRIAKDENFTDREKETGQLAANFRSLINTIIISPRRWGKSSLVEKAAGIAIRKNKKLRVCMIDLFSIRREEEFYNALAMTVLKATSSKWQEAVDSAKKFFRQIVPRIVLNADPGNEFSLSFDWNEIRKEPDEILDLAENIATEKGMKIVVCIDEFQNIAEFNDPLFFQKRLRSRWQKHQNVSYCLYGSKRHMMLDVFTNASMPFYKFGDILLLEKIDSGSWITFIMERFSSTGKYISGEVAEIIVKLADNHPYYVQQLSQQVWLRTPRKCDDVIVQQAHISLTGQLSLLFATITEALTTSQINFLRALISGETALSSADVLTKYRLISSANVSRSRNALIEKDILDDRAGVISFQDPIYRFWLQRYFFAGST